MVESACIEVCKPCTGVPSSSVWLLAFFIAASAAMDSALRAKVSELSVMASSKCLATLYYHGVSAQHLPAYLNEFVFRFNRRLFPMTALASVLAVLGIATRVAGPTYDDLYTGLWHHSAAPTNA